MPELQITHPDPGLWILDDGGINLYLIAGTRRALLLDSGFGAHAQLRARVESLCGLPVELVHTHAHGDHTGGDGEWAQVLLHPAEWDSYRLDHPDGPELLPLCDGDILDLGGRTLEAFHVPGHSPGSVALLDRANRILFSGDVVMTQPVFLFFPTCCIDDYCASLDRLAALAPAFDRIYPSHRRYPLTPEPAIPALRESAELAREGDATKKETFELDLVVTKARFAGYASGAFAVITEALDGALPGAPG